MSSSEFKIKMKQGVKVINGVPLTKNSWIVAHFSKDGDMAQKLVEGLAKVGSKMGISVETPVYCDCFGKADKWIKSIEAKITSKTMIVVVLLPSFDDLYQRLEKHFKCNKGVVMQRVQKRSINHKSFLSIMSNILLQINCKVGGVNYTVGYNPIFKGTMVVGADSSLSCDDKALSLFASIDDNFVQGYSDDFLISDKGAKNANYPFLFFLENAFKQYKKVNKVTPKNLIIYRQGLPKSNLSLARKEIQEIEKFLTNFPNVTFIYMNVCTRGNEVFFEANRNGYCNPAGGMLINNIFGEERKFILQPQYVSDRIGCSNPVAYTILKDTSKIDQAQVENFTFQLSNLYSNWIGAIRVPAMLKNAEVKAKKIATCTKQNYHDNLSETLAFL